MAENKKSFLLYCDLLTTVEKLPDEVAGKLFKLILGYVNDQNPSTDDLLLQIAFEPIKQQLKRDLKNWEKFRDKQSKNGKLGGRPPKTKPFKEKPENPCLNSESQKSLNVTVTATVTDTVNETIILKELEENLVKLYESEIWKNKVCASQKLTPLEFEKIFQHFRAKVITTGETKTVGQLQAYFASYLPKYRKEILNDNGKQGKYTANNAELDELSEIARQQLNSSVNPQG